MPVQTWSVDELAQATAAYAQKEFGLDNNAEREQYVLSVANLAARAHARGDGVAVYVNHDLGHPEIGQWQVLTYGGPDAQLETREDWGQGDLSDDPDHFVIGDDTLRRTLPDIGGRINWRYQLEAVAPAPKALNDPTVDCCNRDAADCDCAKPVLVTLTVRVSPGLDTETATKLVEALVENGLGLYAESAGEIGFAVEDTTGTDAFDKGVALDLIEATGEEVE